jgi:prepilin-type N-terminal cleavage/methylation domain-containing protein
MKNQRFLPDAGFSLLEVLVSIIVVTFFTAAAMQMMVISAAFRAKAKEYATATNLIQKDLENVRLVADQYTFPTPSTVPTVNATSVTLSSSNGGFANGDIIQFENTPDTYKVTNKSGNTLTISPAVVTAPNASSRVINYTPCEAKTKDAGLAKLLQQKTTTYLNASLTNPVSVGDITYTAVASTTNTPNPYIISNTTGLKLWLLRNDNFDNAPYDVLEVNYIVAKDKNGSPNLNQIIAKQSSEVIPRASFQCIRL